MKKENVIVEKSKSFALRIIRLYRYLCSEKNEYILSKQLLRSGTSIGANVKEASETEYWLELLHESGYIEKKPFVSIYEDCQELIKILVTITKSQKGAP